MVCYMGIDIGSAYSKGVLLCGGELVASCVRLSGIDHRATAAAIREQLLASLDVNEPQTVLVVATGVGAGNVGFASNKMSDIVCTARGINRLFPEARTAIDIGAQSTRAIKLDSRGMVTDFAVSEKCAAGSGRFIEVIANVLRIDLEEFGSLSLKSKNPVTFSTGCAVFGESEAITRVVEGVAKEDIAAGVNLALGAKIASLAKRIRLQPPCAVCGGGALNRGLIAAVESELGVRLLLPAEPRTVTALGAAIQAVPKPA
jgi:predicted CoA-substrate-specific enzyme activase